MKKFFTLKKDNKVKKGFTILELLVVVAIIAILAVIATPQFLGAIDKSRVSSEIADITGIGQAVTMYNFDTSSFPLCGTSTQSATVGLITGSAVASNILLANQTVPVTGYNGPYMTTYPSVNRWGGTLAYDVVGNAGDIAALTTSEGVAGLTAAAPANGSVVIELAAIPAADAVALKKGVDSVTVASGASSTTGQLRIDATSATTPNVFYVIH